MSSAKPIGVCLLNMGGPESLEEVQPFLFRLFSDRDLIRLPGGRWLQRPFARMISKLRTKKVQQRYAQIGNGSPLVRITRRQADLLQQSLDQQGDFCVVAAMRYSLPRVEQAIEQLQSRGISQLVALPLYPQHSTATTGSSFNDLRRALASQSPSWRVSYVSDYHDHPLYIEALASTVRRGLDQLGPDATIVFSAHSLPQKLVDRGDPYQRQIESTVRAVAQKLALESWHLGYQSRTGPVRWIGPDVIDLVQRLAAEGVRQVLVVPVSFVSDHIETLYEIDIELRQLGLEHGIQQFVRAPALNEDATFIRCLTQVVLSAAG